MTTKVEWLHAMPISDAVKVMAEPSLREQELMRLLDAALEREAAAVDGLKVARQVAERRELREQWHARRQQRENVDPWQQADLLRSALFGVLGGNKGKITT